jgi:hypothetical protein
MNSARVMPASECVRINLTRVMPAPDHVATATEYVTITTDLVSNLFSSVMFTVADCTKLADSVDKASDPVVVICSRVNICGDHVGHWRTRAGNAIAPTKMSN